jgi:hypothetical protein
MNRGQQAKTSAPPSVTDLLPPPPPVRSPRRCPATTRHDHPFGGGATGVQCKYEQGHDGDHAGYAGFGAGDIFWARAIAGAPEPAGG